MLSPSCGSRSVRICEVLNIIFSVVVVGFTFSGPQKIKPETESLYLKTESMYLKSESMYLKSGSMYLKTESQSQ